MGTPDRRSMLLGLGALALSGCARQAPPATPTGTTTTPTGPAPTPTGVPTRAMPALVGGPREVSVQANGGPRVTKAQVQGEASDPVCRNGVWTFDLPATAAPTERRRSEVWLRRAGGQGAYWPGDRATVEWQTQAWLGDAATSREDWHLLWQLHGATNGVWKGPALAAYVRQGRWFLSGGTGHPALVDGTADYRWDVDLGPFVEGRSHRCRVSVLLSPDPALGRIDAMVDDGPQVTGYRPLSRSGRRPGTMYPGQDVVSPRVGLYRGTLAGAAAPTYEQRVETCVLSVV